jgi:hypothetical protein
MGKEKAPVPAPMSRKVAPGGIKEETLFRISPGYAA